jgi:hypothetical protein
MRRHDEDGPGRVLEDVVRDAAEEGGDGGQAAGAHDDQVGVEFVCALDDRGGDPALVRDPQCARLEAGLAGEAGAMFGESLSLSLRVLVHLTDVWWDGSPAAETRGA